MDLFWDLYLFRVWLCWNWHIPSDTSNASSRGQEGGFSVLGVMVVFLNLYFFSLNFGFIWGLGFLCKPVGVVRFFGLVIFRGIQYRGLVFYSEFGCDPLNIYWYLLYLFPLYFTHLFIHYLLITCPFILQLFFTVLSIVWTLVRWILNPSLYPLSHGVVNECRKSCYKSSFNVRTKLQQCQIFIHTQLAIHLHDIFWQLIVFRRDRVWTNLLCITNPLL